jgi:hypothetical protein
MADKRIIKIDLPELDGNNGKATEYPTGKPRRCRLTLETDKAYSGGVDCTAQVGWMDSQGFTQIALGIGGGGDFSKTYVKIKGIATQKRIDTLHAQTFTPELIEQIKDEVRAYYAAKETPEALRIERARRENAAAMGAAVHELTSSGIDTSTALRMLNID